MTMQTWDVTVTYDVPLPDEPVLDQILENLPSGSAVGGAAVGRSPWSDRLAISITVHGRHVDDASRVGLLLADNALYALVADEPLPRRVGVEVLDEEETERRTVEPQAPDLMSTAEAAEALGITPAAMRQRGQRGELGAVKVGDAGWVFSRRAVEAAAKRAHS